MPILLDYFELCHAETLAPIASLKDGPKRILVEARIGTTRLIDNISVRSRAVVGSKQTEIAQFPPHRLWHGGDAGGA
jgi:hypothetical protein